MFLKTSVSPREDVVVFLHLSLFVLSVFSPPTHRYLVSHHQTKVMWCLWCGVCCQLDDWLWLSASFVCVFVCVCVGLGGAEVKNDELANCKPESQIDPDMHPNRSLLQEHVCMLAKCMEPIQFEAIILLSPRFSAFFRLRLMERRVHRAKIKHWRESIPSNSIDQIKQAYQWKPPTTIFKINAVKWRAPEWHSRPKSSGSQTKLICDG